MSELNYKSLLETDEDSYYYTYGYDNNPVSARVATIDLNRDRLRSARIGSLSKDSKTGEYSVFDGSQWNIINSNMSERRKIVCYPQRPPSPYVGNVYKDDDNNEYFIFDGSQWIEFDQASIGPSYDGTIDEDGCIPGLPNIIVQAMPGTKQATPRNGMSNLNPFGNPINNNRNKPTTPATDADGNHYEDPYINAKTKVPDHLINTTDEIDLKYVYCPFNGDMTVYDVHNNRIDELCGTITRDKYEKIISRCNTETEFDGLKNLKCKVCEFGAVLDKLDALTNPK